MKILHLIQKPQLRGAELFAAQLAKAQMRRGHDVLLVSVFLGKTMVPFEGEVVYLDCLEKNRFWEFKGWRRFSDIIDRFSPDIVQANAADTLKFSVFSKLIFKWHAPIVYRNANKLSGFIKGSLHFKFTEFLFRSISGVISVSSQCNKDFNECFEKLRIPNCTIYNGLDFDDLDRKLQKTVPNNLYQKEFVLMVGAFVEEKNHKGFLPIFNKINKKFPELFLVFVGTGRLEKYIKEFIGKADYADRVLFMGNLDNVLPIMKNAKALVVPSKIEGLPGVILESMYSGVPVLAYDIGGISEAVENDETGFLIPYENKHAFENALESILEKKFHDISTLLENARTMVISRFNIYDIALDFLSFYQQIIDSKKT